MWKTWITKRIQIIDNYNYVKPCYVKFVKFYTKLKAVCDKITDGKNHLNYIFSVSHLIYAPTSQG